MAWSLLADLVLVTHLLFIAFVVFGGLLVFRDGAYAAVHLPVALYGALIEWVGWICPLTPLENRLRELAGGVGYRGGFVEQYLVPVIYPTGYTREVAFALGALVILINAIIYGTWWWRRRRRNGNALRT